jgi:putative tryptophan/tyrosine transport system substrate-binding protein
LSLLLLGRSQPARSRKAGYGALAFYRVRTDAFGNGLQVAFMQGLRTLGWNEDVNLHIDWRWYGADAELAGRQAAELLALKPDVFLAGGNPAVEKIKEQTRTIPIVFALVSDPVGLRYVDSLARPGGNITGFMSYDPPIYTKQLQLFTQITPPATNVAIIYNPQTAPYASRMLQAMKEATAAIGVTLRDVPCHDDTDIETVIATLAREGGGLLPIAEIFNQMHGNTIVTLALKYKVSTVVFSPLMIASGGLISYAIDFPDLYRRSAAYVDRILKGEKPADLPVQAPTKFKLTINLNAAKAIGVTVPQSLIATADEVIE